MKKRKRIYTGFPGSMTKPKEYRWSSPLVLFLFVIFILLLCILILQPYFAAADHKLTEDNDQNTLSALPLLHPTETIIPHATEVPVYVPLLVNANHPLPHDYQPEKLILLNGMETSLFTVKEPDTYIESEILDPFLSMLAAAHADGLTVWQISEGYRSIEAQQQIWDEKYNQYRRENGLSEEKALEAVKRRVASPGCSEHHTGLAVDLTVPDTSFRKTPQAAWLKAHSHEYGFVIRYSAEKEHLTGITEEPWHIRYVGPQAAKIMQEENWCLEEYIQNYCEKFLQKNTF